MTLAAALCWLWLGAAFAGGRPPLLMLAAAAVSALATTLMRERAVACDPDLIPWEDLRQHELLRGIRVGSRLRFRRGRR